MFLSVLILALVVRIGLIGLPGFVYDINDWIAWSQHLGSVGLGNFYFSGVWSDYLPGYLYVLRFLYFLHTLIPNFSYELLVKIPALMSDLVLAIIIYTFAKNRVGDKKASLFAALFLFSPSILANSLLWGQADGFFSIFLCLGILGIFSNKHIWGALAFAMAIATKPQAILFLPLVFFKFKPLKKLWPYFVLTPLVTLALFVPFFQTDLLKNIVGLLTRSTDVYPYTSLYAANIWALVGFWKKDSTIIWGVSYKLWGLLMFAVAWILSFRPRDIFRSAVLISLAFFLFPTRIHERYLYPVFPLLLLAMAVYPRDKRLIISYLILSIINGLNLYYVYAIYNNNFLSFPFLLNSINVLWPVLTITSLIIFIFLCKKRKLF